MAGTQCYGIVKNLSFKLIGNYVVMFSFRGNTNFLASDPTLLCPLFSFLCPLSLWKKGRTKLFEVDFIQFLR